MKRTVAAIAVLAALAWAQTPDVKRIEKKLEEVGNWRLPKEPGYALYDPFKRAEPLVRQTRSKPSAASRRPVLKVTAVMGSRAFVGGRWVKAGDGIGGYRVAEVSEAGVWLMKGKRRLFLPLRRERPLLKIKETVR